MIRFNDVNKSIINLNYVEQMDLNPNLNFFTEDKYYYIRIDYASGNHCFLKYKAFYLYLSSHLPPQKNYIKIRNQFIV